MSRLVLASSSPRRRELLGALGVDFDVIASHIDEAPWLGETPFQTQRRVTHDKAATVAQSLSDPTRLVIACDTTVLLDGEMLNKPADADEARLMLGRLRGRWHEVRSCVVVTQDGIAQAAEVSSRVQMRAFTDAGWKPTSRLATRLTRPARMRPSTRTSSRWPRSAAAR